VIECPCCNRSILKKARKCRHCHAWLEPAASAPVAEWVRWIDDREHSVAMNAGRRFHVVTPTERRNRMMGVATAGVTVVIH
jgi:hypothetical protein